MGIEKQLQQINDKIKAKREKYPLFEVDDISVAMKTIRDQYLAGQPLVWTGPTHLHPSVSATSMGPEWQFSKEGLEYHENNGRDFWDVYTIVAFQLGFHNGTVFQSYRTFEYEKLLDISYLRS